MRAIRSETFKIFVFLTLFVLMKFGTFSNRTSGVRKTDFIIILWVSSKAIFGAQNNVAVVLRAF